MLYIVGLRVKHNTADKLVYLKESLHLMDRKRDAGWKPDLELWESDTDSNASSGDELAALMT